MRLQDLIIGLMIMLVASVVVLAMVFDMYGPQGLNVDLASDNYTSKLYDLQIAAQANMTSIKATNENMWNATPGRSGSLLSNPDVSQGSLMQSSFYALTSVGTYLTSFVQMIGLLFSAVGLNMSSGIFWFFTASIVIIISLSLLNLPFFRNL